MRRTLPLACGILAAVFLPHTTAGTSQADWPQWRGPGLDGISKETAWSVEGKPESLWEKNVGLGYSAVTVKGGRLYTMGHSEEFGEDVAFCLDPETGEEIWAYPFPARVWNRGHGGGTLTTPSIDGEVVYVFNREGNFFCLDAATGEERWRKQLEEEFELELPTWGYSASPLVLDDMIVMNAGHVLAFDKEGKLLWKSPRDYGDSYSTPAVFDYGGRSCLAVFNGNGLVVLGRKKGEEVAFHEWETRYEVNAATPIVIGDRLFISSGYNRGCAMLRLTDEGLKVVWESKVMRTQMSGCVLFEDHLYGFDDSTLKCIDLDGGEKWAQRGLGKAALVLAGDKLVVMSSKGELLIVEASPESYKELSRRKVMDGGVYWTTPVLVGGRIFCRNSNGDLVCLDHRAKSQ